MSLRFVDNIVTDTGTQGMYRQSIKATLSSSDVPMAATPLICSVNFELTGLFHVGIQLMTAR